MQHDFRKFTIQAISEIWELSECYFINTSNVFAQICVSWIFCNYFSYFFFDNPLMEQELFTLSKHLSSPLFFICISGVHVVNNMFLFPCCDVRYLLMLFVFIYVSWCLTQFLFQMMCVSFNSTCNMTGVTCGAGTAYPSRAPEFIPIFQWGSCCLIFSV